MKSYDTAEYASTRLIGTIILYKGMPVEVTSCVDAAKGIHITAAYIDTGNPVKGYLEEFDMNPPLLGYVNYGTVVSYFTRMPMRKDWKQGFRQNSITSVNGMVPINPKAISDTIQGKFPSLKEAITKLIKKAAKSVAFDRNFAIHNDGKVWYKGVLSVGVVSFDTGAIKLNAGSEWVRESLSEVVGEIA